jgi:hypothetical protein
MQLQEKGFYTPLEDVTCTIITKIEEPAVADQRKALMIEADCLFIQIEVQPSKKDG